jgi:hypothetical protein
LTRAWRWSRIGRRLASALGSGLALTGCILETEPCGQGFRWVGDRCMPFGRVDAELPDGSGWPAFDGEVPDAAAVPDARTPPRADAVFDAVVDAEGPNPYAGVISVLIVDRTPDDLLGATPTTPGCDVDGLELTGPGVSTFATKVLSSLVFDPFDQSVGGPEDASLGPPEQTGAVGTFVSLGGGGAYQLLHVQPQRPLAPGDRLRLVEFPEPGDVGDRCAIWVCAADTVDLTRCVFVGEGRGGAFEL